MEFLLVLATICKPVRDTDFVNSNNLQLRVHNLSVGLCQIDTALHYIEPQSIRLPIWELHFVTCHVMLVKSALHKKFGRITGKLSLKDNDELEKMTSFHLNQDDALSI